MKTSHEMTVSVLKKRDKILRRRRILITSVGAAAGTAAAAAALAITLNITHPRGVDLVNIGTATQPAVPSGYENSVSDDMNEPQYLYNDVEITADAGSNSSYSELADSLEIYSGSMNFFEFTIIKQYTPDEAAELTGSDIFRSSSTLFSAHIGYDHLREKKVDMDILLAQEGSAESQIENHPLYGVGETYIAFLPEFGEGSWNSACPELLFALNGSDACMHLNAEQITFETADGVKLGEEIPEDMQYIYTTTSNNPVRYVRGYGVTEISDFLRSDWTARGLLTVSGAGVPSGLYSIDTSDIPEISADERGIEAVGARNILLDTKTAGAYSVLLVGDYVSIDPEKKPGMLNCFKFGVEIYDGYTVSALSGGPFDLGQGGYLLYSDRLADYTEVFKFGDNYIIVLRYYDSDGSCRAVFHAIKGGELYPQLMGDYSAVTGVQMGVTTWLSENITADEENCTITDSDSGISYIFDFDAMNDIFTRVHYTAVKSGSKEEVSIQLAENWLDKWKDISANMDMVKPQASIFSFGLKDGSKLAAIVYPCYKTNSAVLYRVYDGGYTEYGELSCGWQFELLENSEEQYLHIAVKYNGSAAYNNRTEIDDIYYRITETALEQVLKTGRNIYGDEENDRFVYENDDVTHISAEEYEQLKNAALKHSTVIASSDLDADGDGDNDEYCDFENDTEGLIAAILSVL